MIGLGPDNAAPIDAEQVAVKLRAVRLAARCFEIARRTTFAGERDAAISRGIAIAGKAGLRLDLFDIPGRAETDTLRHAVQDAVATLDRWADALGSRPGETLYDAKRRAFDRADHDAAERDRQSGRRAAPPLNRDAMRRADLRDRWPSTVSTITALRARRLDVFPATDLARPDIQCWVVPRIRFFEPLDEWQLRALADEVCG